MGLGEGSEVSLKFSQAEKVSEVRQQLQDSMYSTSVWNDKESVSFLCVLFFYITFTEAKDFRKSYSLNMYCIEGQSGLSVCHRESLGKVCLPVA